MGKKQSRRKFSTQFITWPMIGATLPCFAAPKQQLIQNKIPSSGEQVPAIGMGTWITFNVGASQSLRQQRTEVLRTFFAKGGGLIDSSPMYGSAQGVLGHCLKKLAYPSGLIAADKIWTSSTKEGPEQFQEMQSLWGLKKFGLVQVHNLLNWQAHLTYLKELKKKGLVKYIGVTTSHGRRHDDLAAILKSQPIDFVQLTYNITHREVEKELLPLAADKGIAVIANRPYDGGTLMDQHKAKPLPGVAAEAGIKTWSELFLKWIVSHPAMTVAIPATSKIAHMQENMAAGTGTLFDEKLRQQLTKALG